MTDGKYPVYRGNKHEVAWLPTAKDALFVGRAESLIQKMNATLLVKEWKETSILERFKYAMSGRLPGAEYTRYTEKAKEDTLDIYRSHKIETFKDAQKSQTDSIAFVYIHDARQVAVKRDNSKWLTTTGEMYTDMDMIGWTVLEGVYDGFLL